MINRLEKEKHYQATWFLENGLEICGKLMFIYKCINYITNRNVYHNENHLTMYNNSCGLRTFFSPEYVKNFNRMRHTTQLNSTVFMSSPRSRLLYLNQPLA